MRLILIAHQTNHCNPLKTIALFGISLQERSEYTLAIFGAVEVVVRGDAGCFLRSRIRTADSATTAAAHRPPY